jgi:hypothetical protein
VVDDTQHDGEQRDTEDVIAVCEETGAGDEDGADVVPAKGGLVDFSQGEAAALVGVLDVLWWNVSGLFVVLDGVVRERLTAKSLTWLWKALLPPAVLRPAVFALAMLGLDLSFPRADTKKSQGIRRGLCADASRAVRLGQQDLGVVHLYTAVLGVLASGGHCWSI